MPDVSATTVPEKKPINPITWGALAAVVGTVVIYLLSQLFASLVILAIGKGKGFNQAQLEAWVNQVGPQFFYILIIEAFTVGMVWLFLHYRKASLKVLGFHRPHWRDLGYTLLGVGVYFSLLIAATEAVKRWVPSINVDQSQQIGFNNPHGPQLILVFIGLAVLPPIAEEILARGFLFLGLRRRLPLIWAALLTSLIFASAHLQFGSGAPLLWVAAIDTFLLSIVLVGLRVKTGQLWAPIAVHMIKNTIAFMALFIFVK
jgi:membrane protease YdiL (CAAX protease family)